MLQLAGKAQLAIQSTGTTRCTMTIGITNHCMKIGNELNTHNVCSIISLQVGETTSGANTNDPQHNSALWVCGSGIQVRTQHKMPQFQKV